MNTLLFTTHPVHPDRAEDFPNRVESLGEAENRTSVPSFSDAESFVNIYDEEEEFTLSDNPMPPNTSLLRPGHNCWRIEQATKLQFLIDGEDYFRALRCALLQAQQAIYIVGWDIDSRVSIPRNDESDTLPEPLAQFLGALAAARPDLHIYILSWDYAFLFTLEREWLPVLPLPWRTHERVHFKLDNQHPAGASHHQKLVVIDDSLAFIGGIDLTRCRWDNCSHAPQFERRCDADGKPYSPFHDIEAVLEGPVAQALGDLARERWQRAHKKKSGAPLVRPQFDTHHSVWPAHLEPALENIPVALARTEAAYSAVTEDANAVTEKFEIRNFYFDAIAAARDIIFFENQYFSSHTIAQALKEKLDASDGPEVVLIAPRRESGWLEENTMGLLRTRLYAQLQVNTSRFYSYSPLLADGSNLNVHSKLMIVDDEWLTLGSANLSNRSMQLDTECNLIVGAQLAGKRGHEVREAIAKLRHGLLAEHLDRPVDEVAAVHRRMGLIDTIETLRVGARAPGAETQRTLVLTDPIPTADSVILADPMLIDPEAPLEPEQVLNSYIAPRDHKPLLSHARYIGVVAIITAVVVLLWRETSLREFFDIDYLLNFVERLQKQPLAPLFVLALYVIGGLLFVPIVLLIAATGAVFGPLLGFVYAVCGSLLSAAVAFWLGTKLDSRLGGGQWLGRRIHGLRRRLQEQGILAVAMVRAMPIAPFTAVNLIAGAARVPWRDFFIGTVIGMLPGIALTVLFVDRASAALRKPSLGSITTLLGTMAIIVVTSLLLQHWLRNKKSKH